MVMMAVTAFAQSERGFRMGIRANVGVSNVIYEDDEAAFGYGIGWIAEYSFNPHVYIQSGIGLENISHKEYYVNGAFDAYYAQLPVHIGCRTGVRGGKKLFVQAGLLSAMACTVPMSMMAAPLKSITLIWQSVSIWGWVAASALRAATSRLVWALITASWM